MKFRWTRPSLARLLACTAVVGAACTTNLATLPGSTPAVGPDGKPEPVRALDLGDPATGKPARWAADQLVTDTHMTAAGFEFSSTLVANAAGAIATTGSGTVKVNGMGERGIQWDELDFPPMSDEFDQVTVTDKATENRRTYGADQAFQNYFVQDGKTRLEIAADPSGGWRIDGKPAADTEEAARLAMESPAIQTASLHGLTALYGVLAIRPQETTRMVMPTSINKKSANSKLSLKNAAPDPAPLVAAIIELKRQAADPTIPEGKPASPADEPFETAPLVCPVL